jgi:signal transduction histidine kinase
MVAAPVSRPGVQPHPPEPGVDLAQLAQLVSHELRQPAQAIRSFVSILLHERAGPLNAIQRDFLLTADHALRRLERLIADCEVTLSQSRGLELVAQPIDLLEHVYGCVREVRPLAEANGLELAVAAPAGDSFACFADPDRIDQVLLNLLENACLYATPGSTIDIRLRRSRRSALCVIENDVDGTPIDVAAWNEPFQRGADSHTLHPKGKGLGLAVVHRLVSAHGGRVLARGGARTVKIGFVIPNTLSCLD